MITATKEHYSVVKEMISYTINSIYTNYYPAGAVDYFLNHHSDNNIMNAINREEIYLFKSENNFVGTGSVSENEISRLFVLPQYHRKGYGTEIMDKLENIIYKTFDKSVLSASLPALEMYLKRGYKLVEYHKILTQNSHYLCYWSMERKRD